MLIAACGPKVGEISGASKAELDQACKSLSRIGWDYWSLGLGTGGRILEVSADIHTFHPGPEKTKKYCEGR
jgi:hypothetical protein